MIAARRRPSSDYRMALRRLEVLSRSPAELARAASEHDLHEKLTQVVQRTFSPRRAAVFGANRSGRMLLPPGTPETRALLADLCAHIDAIPAATRAAQESLRELLPYLVVPHVLPPDPENDVGAMVSAPVLDGNRLLALIAVEADPSAGEFELPDLHALSALASNAALVAQRLRALETTDAQRRIERDLDLAREIQRRFLPRLDHVRDGVRVTAEYHPAYDVGGDFYDVVDGDDGAVTAVIGDVSGKGVQAALLMSRVSSDFRRLPRGGSAQGLLELLNQATCEHTPDDSFATAVVVRLDASRRTLTVANAGHVRPLVRRANGTVEEAGATSGLPLGMLPGQSYLQEECAVGPGDIVLLMTDAVVEALDQDQDRLGSEGLRRIIANAPADAGEIHRRILVAVEDSLGSRHADDLTLLAIEIQG